MKDTSVSKRSSVRYSQTEKDALAKVFQEIIDIERSLERHKYTLMKMEDFTMIDAFGLLDEAGKGFITPPELREQLLDFGIRCSIDEIQLLFERYNVSQDEKLKYSEFQEAIMAQDPQQAKMLVNRRLQYSGGGRQTFSYDTLSKFIYLLEALV